jgi:hypothetical protein
MNSSFSLVIENKKCILFYGTFSIRQADENSERISVAKENKKEIITK